MDASVKVAKLNEKARERETWVKFGDNATQIGLAVLCNPVFSVLGGYILTEIASDTTRKIEYKEMVDTDGSITGTPGTKYIQATRYTWLSQNGASDVKKTLIGSALLGAFGNLGAVLLQTLTKVK